MIKKILKGILKCGNKLATLIGKEIDTEPVYGGSDKYIKAKIKI